MYRAKVTISKVHSKIKYLKEVICQLATCIRFSNWHTHRQTYKHTHTHSNLDSIRTKRQLHGIFNSTLALSSQLSSQQHYIFMYIHLPLQFSTARIPRICGHSISTEAVFVTHLSSNVGISGWWIEWVMKIVIFMNHILCVSASFSSASPHQIWKQKSNMMSYL